MKLPLHSIIIEDRQRTDLGDIDKLAESMRENGQISPVLVAADGDTQWRLVAGGRRCAAAKTLNWTSIEAVDRVTIDDRVILVRDLTLLQLQILEYEENVRRKDIDWKEACRAIAKLHMLKQLEYGFAVKGTGSADTWTERKMADFTGYNRSQVHYMLAIARELEREPKSDIHACVNYSDAFQFLVRKAENEVNAEIERRRQRSNPPLPGVEVSASPGAASILSSTEEASPERVVVYLHGVPKAFEDCVPGEDFMTNAASCVIALSPSPKIASNLYATLRPNGFAVLWNWFPSTPLPGLTMMPGAIVWNKVKVILPHTVWPFAQNYVLGRVFTPNMSSVEKLNPAGAVVSCVPEALEAKLGVGDVLPAAVVDYTISPLTLDGMAVECIGGVDPVHVAELGRVPIWYEPDPAKYALTVERLRSFYETNIPNVEIRLRQ